MGYKQTRTFDHSRMGTRAGWCLMNVRLGFGVNAGKYPSALADMQAQKANGTLHDITTIPRNCAVPVYCDTPSRYEHVVAYDHGKVWSDGRLTTLDSFRCFGWGELVDGVRVVEFTPDKPRELAFDKNYCDGFVPVHSQWQKGDRHAKIAELAKWLRANYPAYTSPKALGDIFGPNLEAAVREFQRRARVSKKYGGAVDGMVGPRTYGTLKAYGFTHAGIKPVENPKPEPKPQPKPTPQPVEPAPKPEPEIKPEPKPETPAPKPQEPAGKPETEKPQEHPKLEEKPAGRPENAQEDEEYKADLTLADAQVTIKKLTETVELMKAAQKKHHLPSFAMPAKIYDILKFAATTGLPAFNTLYIGLSHIWGFGLGQEIDATVQLVIAFINAILGAVVIKASVDYKKASAEK